MSATDVLLSAYSFLANLIFSGDSAFGRPPSFPLDLAASSPALVRSLMISRSNSASAPKMWKMSFPPDYAATKRARGGEADFEPQLKVTTRAVADGTEIRVRDNGV